MKKTNADKPKGEEKILIIPGPTSDRVFQLPIPPMTKPRMDAALRSGVSSGHRDLNGNKSVRIRHVADLRYRISRVVDVY